MAGARTSGAGRRWLALALALIAVLLQVNAPVAHAAAMADPLQSAFCHDSVSGSGARHSDRREPADRSQPCAACGVCCAAPAALGAAEAPSLPAPSSAVRVVQRPEILARSVRGPPRTPPRARGPPAAFA